MNLIAQLCWRRESFSHEKYICYCHLLPWKLLFLFAFSIHSDKAVQRLWCLEMMELCMCAVQIANFWSWVPNVLRKIWRWILIDMKYLLIAWSRPYTHETGIMNHMDSLKTIMHHYIQLLVYDFPKNLQQTANMKENIFL